MDERKAIESLGFSLPSPPYLIGMFLFGVIGFAAYRYGKTTSRPALLWLGVVLMLYPYVVSETWLLYVVGCALCGCIYWLRDWHTRHG